MSDSKRLFTAIRFNSKTLDQIEKIQSQLKQIDPKARYVNPITNFHLTLYFIGQVKDIDVVEKAFKEACQKYQREINKPIQIEFTKLGFFKNRGGNILWLGAKETPELKDLVNLIYSELSKTDLNLKPSNFKAHITLARKFKGDLPEKIELPKPITATEAALVWSHRNEQDTLVYDNIFKHTLILK